MLEFIYTERNEFSHLPETRIGATTLPFVINARRTWLAFDSANDVISLHRDICVRIWQLMKEQRLTLSSQLVKRPIR